MANTNADVLRVTALDSAMSTTIREKQLGFATDTFELHFKAPGGTTYQYAAQDQDTYHANYYADEFIYHDGDVDTYLRFQDDDIRMFAGNVEMIRLTEGASDYVLFAPGSSTALVGIGTDTPTRRLEVSTNSTSASTPQNICRFSSYTQDAGGAVAGFGVNLEFAIEDSTNTDTLDLAAALAVYWDTVDTDSIIRLSGFDGGAEKNWYFFKKDGLSIGDGTQDTDYQIRFDALSDTGIITFKEDESWFEYNKDILFSTRNEGVYWASKSVGILGEITDGITMIAGARIRMRTQYLLIDPDSGGDSYIQFDGTTNDGLVYWREPEDCFEFTDDVSMGDGEDLYFYGSGAVVPETDGNWRLAVDGNDLQFQKRVSGSWEQKSGTYGHMYMENAGQTVTVSATNTDYEVQGFTEGETDNVTFDATNGEYLEVETAGRYRVEFQCAFTCVSSNQDAELGIAVNGTRTSAITTHRKIGTGADTGSCSGCGILSLSKDDEVSLVMRNLTTTANFTVDHAQVNVEWIADD